MDEVFLARSVHNLLRQICIEKNQPWPDIDVRRRLASLSEDKALEVLHNIYNNSRDIRTLNEFIKFMIWKYILGFKSKSGRERKCAQLRLQGNAQGREAKGDRAYDFNKSL
ncbi:hypothetical protein M0R45_016462 [Rubus argutus]|uniref:RDRP3-5 N-terminal domain-containing protein n=1 Tax=Rubus argutus TaxID=59490 RepID=A0AAW1XT53_RUBAR